MAHKRILLTEICRKGEISKENMFYHIVSDVEIKIDKEKFPDNIFFLKNGEYFFEQDSKNGWFNCRHKLYWSIFEREFGMDYYEIQSFTKRMVEQYFKIRMSTPYVNEIHSFRNHMVEQHFRMKILTPQLSMTMSTIAKNILR